MPDKAKIAVLGASGFNTGAEFWCGSSFAIRASRSSCSPPIAAPARETSHGRASLPQFAPLRRCCRPRARSRKPIGRRVGLDLCLLRAAAPAPRKRLSQGCDGARDDNESRRYCRPISAMADPTALRALVTWPWGATPRPNLQQEAVYGLTEIYRDRIKAATARRQSRLLHMRAELALIPLLQSQGHRPRTRSSSMPVERMTGAGRAAKEEMLFCEWPRGHSMPMAKCAGQHRQAWTRTRPGIFLRPPAVTGVVVTFTPHLVPMNRGILSTIYVRGLKGLAAGATRCF